MEGVNMPTTVKVMNCAACRSATRSLLRIPGMIGEAQLRGKGIPKCLGKSGTVLDI